MVLVENLWELNSICPNSRTVIGPALHHKRHDSAALGEFETGKTLGSFVTPDVVDITKLDRAKTVNSSAGCED